MFIYTEYSFFSDARDIHYGDEKLLIDSLLKPYNRYARPVRNLTKTVDVFVDLVVVQYVDLVGLIVSNLKALKLKFVAPMTEQIEIRRVRFLEGSEGTQ